MQSTTSRVSAFGAAVLGFVGLTLSGMDGGVGIAGLFIAGLALLVLLTVAWGALEPRPTPPPSANWPSEPPMPATAFERVEPEWAAEETPPMEPEEQPYFAPPPEPEPASQPEIDLDSPLQRALAGLPPKPPARGKYSPRMPVIPDEATGGERPVQRARRLVPSGQTLGEKRERTQAAKERAAKEVEFTIVLAKPRVRPTVMAKESVPMVVAQVAGKERAPPQLARGKCSGCDTLLWAPKIRPINLRCPECDRITLLR